MDDRQPCRKPKQHPGKNSQQHGTLQRRDRGITNKPSECRYHQRHTDILRQPYGCVSLEVTPVIKADCSFISLCPEEESEELVGSFEILLPISFYPSSMIWVQLLMVVKRCAMIKIVRLALRSSIASMTACSVLLSNALVASSKINTVAFL